MVGLLVAGGTTLAMAMTEVVIEPGVDYLTLAFKTVPALTVLGIIVYLFIRYLERRDRDLRDLLERTVTALTENAVILNEIKAELKKK
jgi:large-conductance mechanosensitive channel